MKERIIELHRKDGLLHLNNERIIIASTKVYPLMRQQLTIHLGKKRASQFMKRYGWSLGAADAKEVVQDPITDLEEILRKCSNLHSLKGYTHAKTSHVAIESDEVGEVTSVLISGIWSHSFEADEQLRTVGISSEAVCDLLVGYASGYYSTICRTTVLFKEIACRGAGDAVCRYVGRTLSEWGLEGEEEYKAYKGLTIQQELTKAYEQLLVERNHLARAAVLHKRLAKYTVDGGSLQAIANTVFETTKTACLVEDGQFQCLASAGLSSLQKSAAYTEILTYEERTKGQTRNKTLSLQLTTHRRVRTPIFVDGLIVGYCSFIYAAHDQRPKEHEKMLIERMATVCTLYVFYTERSYESLQRVRGYLLEQLVYGYFRTKEEMIERGKIFEIDLTQNYHFLLLQLPVTEEQYVESEKMLATMHHFFQEEKKEVLLSRVDCYVSLWVAEKDTTTTKYMIERLLQRLHADYPTGVFSVGMSRSTEELTKIEKAKEEALFSLRYADSSEPIREINQIPIKTLLLHRASSSLLMNSVHAILQPILLATPTAIHLKTVLTLFFQNNLNKADVARELQVSEQEVIQDLQNVEKLLHIQLANFSDVMNIQLAMEQLLVQ